MNKNENIKKAITSVVKSTLTEEKGKKSKGTVIATVVRDSPLVSVEPFSL